MKLFIEENQFKDELSELAGLIVADAKVHSPEVESTYSKTFGINECIEAILYYIKYCLQNNVYFINEKETGFLVDPFFRYIVVGITGDSTYSWEKKGIRDRVWVYIVTLKKLSSSFSKYNKFYNPYKFQIEFEKSQELPVSPDIPVLPLEPVRPADPVVPEEKTNYILIIAGIAGVVVITKLLKVW